MRLNRLSTTRLDKKLASYTLLGAAAFTVSGKAHAEDITYVPVNQHFDGAAGAVTYNLNLSGGTSPDISISTYSMTGEEIDASAANGAQILTSGYDTALSPDNFYTVAALGPGATINPNAGPAAPGTAGWQGGGKLAGSFSALKTGDWSQDGGSAYLGFYYTAMDGNHAGWINLSTSNDFINMGTTNDPNFTINSYAFDNTPNEAIMTPGATPAVPEPSSLSLLAMGAAGLLEVRRRRQNHG